jgi:phosphoglucosamine mutase
MEKLFGTDGIRGVASEYPITEEMAIRVGRAAAQVFGQNSCSPKIIIGKDSRISGDMLEHGLLAGICSSGAQAFLAGVLPTPGVAFLIKSLNLDGAVMISASHNPFHDNGFKFFTGDGFKPNDDAENSIEALVLQNQKAESPLQKGETVGKVHTVADAAARYEGFLRGIVESNGLRGLRIVLDCANGATSHVAPAVFTALGAQISVLACNPDGFNINQDCGSEHTEKLAEEVVRSSAHAGFAFDGDGDRVIAFDAAGNRVSGDKILAICAKSMKERGQLIRNLVVSTVMSNIGLGHALGKLGIENFKTQKVGDRHVLEQMLKLEARIGGEESGHIIFLDHHTTGDGIIGALKIAAIMKDSGKPLNVLAGIMEDFPQFKAKVGVKRKPDIETEPDIVAAIKNAESALGNEGQVVVRYSETEHMCCRIMVGGRTLETAQKHCQEITEVVQRVLG